MGLFSVESLSLLWNFQRLIDLEENVNWFFIHSLNPNTKPVQNDHQINVFALVDAQIMFWKQNYMGTQNFQKVTLNLSFLHDFEAGWHPVKSKSAQSGKPLSRKKGLLLNCKASWLSASNSILSRVHRDNWGENSFDLNFSLILWTRSKLRSISIWNWAMRFRLGEVEIRPFWPLLIWESASRKWTHILILPPQLWHHFLLFILKEDPYLLWKCSDISSNCSNGSIEDKSFSKNRILNQRDVLIAQRSSIYLNSFLKNQEKEWKIEAG